MSGPDRPEPQAPRAARFPASFIRARWAGRVPVARLLWKDMIVHGTTINVAAALAGLLLFVREAPTALAVCVYFAPLPYNLFLLAALWRTASRTEEPLASLVRLAGAAWFAVMLVL